MLKKKKKKKKNENHINAMFIQILSIRIDWGKTDHLLSESTLPKDLRT